MFHYSVNVKKLLSLSLIFILTFHPFYNLLLGLLESNFSVYLWSTLFMFMELYQPEQELPRLVVGSHLLTSVPNLLNI